MCTSRDQFISLNHEAKINLQRLVAANNVIERPDLKCHAASLSFRIQKIPLSAECAHMWESAPRERIINVIYRSELGFEMEIKKKLIHNAIRMVKRESFIQWNSFFALFLS
jgi:hypothetical protein